MTVSGDRTDPGMVWDEHPSMSFPLVPLGEGTGTHGVIRDIPLPVPGWEKGMGDRNGSFGTDLQQPFIPGCSKGKDFLRKQLKGKLPNPQG